MSAPLLLDLFCKDGGASMGYSRAGFEVVGCDIDQRSRYPFDFIHGDALKVLRTLISGGIVRSNSLFGRNYELSDFAAIAASPPCQSYCALKHFTRKKHPDLVADVRDLLQQTGLPYVIENVPGAPLNKPIILCGTMFGLQTDCGASLLRHRLFESNWPLKCDLQCNHGERTLAVVGTGMAVSGGRTRTICITEHTAMDHAARYSQRKTIICVTGHTADKYPRRSITITGSTAQRQVEHNSVRETFSVKAAQTAMGIDWMTMEGLSQAIPPAYTEYIGRQLLEMI